MKKKKKPPASSRKTNQVTYRSNRDSGQKILLLGYKGVGKKRFIKAISKRRNLPIDRLISLSITLSCCANATTLLSVNPQKQETPAMSSFLQLATGAIILIKASDEQATKQLLFLLGYCKEKKISNIGVGIWHTQNDKALLSLDDVQKMLIEKGFIIPVVAIEDSNTDDINILLEAVCVIGISQ